MSCDQIPADRRLAIRRNGDAPITLKELTTCGEKYIIGIKTPGGPHPAAWCKIRMDGEHPIEYTILEPKETFCSRNRCHECGNLPITITLCDGSSITLHAEDCGDNTVLVYYV